MGAEPVRVISGSKRGTKLLFIENDSVRPTTDRVKEAVFNIIQFHVRDSSVLDLFAGCGGLGIEALSCRSSLWQKAYILISAQLTAIRIQR